MSDNVRLKPEGNYTERFFQSVVVGDMFDTRYEDHPRWGCLDCGAVVADREAHDSFHAALFRAACRG